MLIFRAWATCACPCPKTMISRRCQLVSNSTLQVFELTSQLTENTWPATINHTVIITKGALQMRKECIQLIKKVDESRFLAVLTIGFSKMENKNITCTFYED